MSGSFSIKSQQRRIRKLFLTKGGLGTPTLTGLSSDEATITDTGVGDYKINFNKAYSVADLTVMLGDSTSDVHCELGTKAKGSIQVLCRSLPVAEKSAVLSLNGIKFHSLLQGADGNDITIEITGGATAGSEVITSTSAGAITIQVETTVSTATQVVAALKALTTGIVDAFVGYELITGATTWATAGAANLAGGVNGVAAAAAEGDFDIEVTGSDIIDRYSQESD